MAETSPFKPVKYFCGIIRTPYVDLKKVEKGLSARLGSVELMSEEHLFDATDYYRDQMGPDLLRRFIAFEPLRDPSELPSIKLVTNGLEREFSEGSPYSRAVNLDPGYLDGAQMVLASAKPLAHRLPLRDGIYAQLEYLFRRGGKVRFQEWTFPEYRRDAVARFFVTVMNRYLEQLRELSAKNGA